LGWFIRGAACGRPKKFGKYKSLNGPPKFSKILHEKYKSILFVFSEDTPKKIFWPAAGRRLSQAHENNPV
jgi:hypothetical protein